MLHVASTHPPTPLVYPSRFVIQLIQALKEMHIWPLADLADLFADLSKREDRPQFFPFAVRTPKKGTLFSMVDVYPENSMADAKYVLPVAPPLLCLFTIHHSVFIAINSEVRSTGWIL